MRRPTSGTNQVTDLLLPRTDAGVAAQLVVFIIAAISFMVLVRRHREWLLLATGATLFVLGLFGVRAVH